MEGYETTMSLRFAFFPTQSDFDSKCECESESTASKSRLSRSETVHLEEEREVVPESRPRFLAQETLVVGDVLLEGQTAARTGQDGGPVGVRAHPEFGVGPALVDFEVGVGRGLEEGHLACLSRFPPGIVLNRTR